MSNTPNEYEDAESELGAKDLIVETLEFPFDMGALEFGNVHQIDGTVLHLNMLEPGSDNTIILKALDDGLIHLVAESGVIESGIVGDGAANSAADVLGYHYYVFGDELTVYAEQALVLLN